MASSARDVPSPPLQVDLCPGPPIRIGTRASPLALAQAHQVAARLAQAHADLAVEGAIEIVHVTTTGDKVTDRALAEIGGKGLFTEEIEAGLLERRIDLAVHSMKDVPTWLPDGLEIACILPREDPRDALLAANGAGASIAGLREGAVVGTASLRRKAQLLAARPDLEVVLFRGNVGTRLRKLDAGEVDATLLAIAGLNRLDMASRAASVLAPEEMLPAVAQGAVGIEIRAGDTAARARLTALEDPTTRLCVDAERALLEVLDGTCHTPVGALAELEPDGSVRLRALLAAPDGSELHCAERRGAASDAIEMGRDAGAELRSKAGPALRALIGLGER